MRYGTLSDDQLAGLYAYPAGDVLRANMVSSADGAASLDGASAGLSSAADRHVFALLRTLADVILVGANTARVERYAPVRIRELWRHLRDGRTPTPPIAVVTASGDLDPSSPLIAAADARTIVLTTSSAPAAARSRLARHAEVVVAGSTSVDMKAAVQALHDRGHSHILAEGGPGILAQLVAAGLLDELCLTIGPVLAGPGAPRILTGSPMAAPVPLSLAHVLEDDGFLLCRYASQRLVWINMDMTTALAGLGVTASSIDDETREQLDRDGYAPLAGVLSEPVLEAMRKRLAGLLAAEGDQAGLEVHQEAGTDRLADLVNKDPVFDVCFTDPGLLACVAHVLGEFKLSSLNFRAALPGEGLQALHAEGGPCTDPAGYQVCNSIWLLDDFTADNGATRVVPGSHRSGKSVGNEMPDVRAAHPEEVLLLAPAGTVVVFNSHLWHGGTLNSSSMPRRALHSYFTRRGNSQQLDQRKYVRPETLDRLTPEARFILDV